MSLASRLSDAQKNGKNVGFALAKMKLAVKLRDDVTVRIEGIRPDEVSELDTPEGIVTVYDSRCMVKASDKVGKNISRSTEVNGSLAAGWIAEEYGVSEYSQTEETEEATAK